MTIYRFVVIFTLTLAISCNKDVRLAEEPHPFPVFDDPVVKPKGRAIGKTVSAEIGPNGGVLWYGDVVRLEIPPGAVNEQTTFGIQPIGNTFDETSVNPAFRLFPEHIHFNKPVEISFLYSPDAGGNPITRIVAFQREDGVWCGSSTEHNSSQRRLIVETTHFSDWVWFDLISLRKDKESIGAGETVNLKLLEQILGELMPVNHIDSVPLAAMDDIGSSKDITVSEWKILSGPGSLSSKINSHLLLGDAIYTAPETVHEVTDVEIQVELESKSGYISDRSAPNGRRKLGKLVLLTTVRLLPENFVQLKLGGVVQDLSQIENDAKLVNGSIYVRLGGQNAPISLTLQYFGTIPGGYPGGSAIGEAAVYFAEVVGGERSFFNNFYRTCENDHIYNGRATLTAIDEYIQGSFSGQIFPVNVQNCEVPEPKAVELNFKIKQN
ncbi:hypothetical protein [Sphingobacterium suaedae]|uniref:ZU5 domain-containing protein n=1 Tax=Sphingobacterium suaedae TaxID=1686402 RepID=A0ABW5KJQ6_9SPHI